MARSRTTSPAAPPPGATVKPPRPEPQPQAPPQFREAAPIVASLVAILNAIETGPKAGPALKAYRSAMRRQGEAAAAIGGGDAMEAVLLQVAEAAPDRAEQRRRVVADAWIGLPEWRL